MGVFDGHGKYGHEISQFTRIFFQNTFKSYVSSENIKRDEIDEIFSNCSQAISDEFCEVSPAITFRIAIDLIKEKSENFSGVVQLPEWCCGIETE